MEDSTTATTFLRQEDIFGPLFAMQILTMIVWFYMYSRRIPFLVGYIEKHSNNHQKKKKKKKKDEDEQVGAAANITMEDLSDPSSPHYFPKIPMPAAVINPSDNLKNLFEIPVLFYALVMFLYLTKSVDNVYIQMSWIFVVFRYLHSINHCTFNHVTSRFHTYVVSTMTLWLMLLRAAFAYFWLG